MVLLNPRKHAREYPDQRSTEVMLKTIEFFEKKGKRKLKQDDHDRVWYSDFLEFVKREKIFATILTPAGYGAGDSRWDTWRISEFAEILAFYGLQYWYTWQVSVLGLGPIWMSHNEEQKKRAAQLLEDGGIFAFGLSEKEHGADLYASDMTLLPEGDGTYKARGNKYYIGNANEAAMVSTFGKTADSGEYVFFVADPRHEKYECVKNIVNSQNYVAEYALHDYPVTESDFLSKGQEAWNAALNTVNIGKYNLGWASIGIATHALYEAVKHAANRRLYNMYVTDFPHVRQLFTDAYTRLVAMKLVALRAADYMVTTQGEDVINHLWDVIAAKGFEKDMYFEMAARDIRALPKLEGTVHVNIALIVKFMANYFFNPAEYPEVPQRNDPSNDDFLFDQGATRGLSKIRFHDYSPVFKSYDLPNVNLFQEQITMFKEFLVNAGPNDAQTKDVDFLLSLGEIFTLVVYGQLLLENSRIYEIEHELVDQIFDFLVRDFSRFALQLYSKPSSTPQQADYCMRIITRPAANEARYLRVWNDHVLPLKDAYEMNE
jgi:acyl-CoA dehydrogenase